jgi:hypothetical protein
MSLYLLDTDTVSLYQHGHPLVCAAVGSRPSEAVVISIMTVRRRRRPRRSGRLRRVPEPAKKQMRPLILVPKIAIDLIKSTDRSPSMLRNTKSIVQRFGMDCVPSEENR